MIKTLKQEPSAEVMSGKDAFTLFDTYGFPLEITCELLAAQGMKVNTEEFHLEMEEQRQRSKDSRDEVDMMSGANVTSLVASMGSTQFLGYSSLESSSRVLAIFVEGAQVCSRFHCLCRVAAGM